MRDFIYYIDTPQNVKDIENKRFVPITGWAASHYPIETIEVHVDDKIYECEKVERKDVENVYGQQYTYIHGFTVDVNTHQVLNKPNFEASIAFYRENLPVEMAEINVALTKELKESYESILSKFTYKQEFIKQHLVCPACLSGNLNITQHDIICKACQNTYQLVTGKPSMLTDLIVESGKIVSTTNISAHDYDVIIKDIIKKNPEKMFLDAGAGLRPVYYKNVVNLEIVNYDTTDVIASGEAIPFESETFDGVFSVAVMEHVPNFFVYAENILRVLKKDGIIFCAVPFMQPEHGYPYHFYNMTYNGLLNLFTQHVEFIETGFMKPAMHPFTSLKWFVDIYANGLLHPDDKTQFLNMRIADILAMGAEEIQHIISAQNLQESEWRKITGGSYFVGTKK